MKVGLAQIAPLFLDREKTIAKVVKWIGDAAARECELVAFGEALVPAYPFWLCRTDGARFDAPDQKEWYAQYVDQSVAIESGHLDPVCEAAKKHEIFVVLGIIEHPTDRGGHSLFCSRVFIDDTGQILSVHRKLMPTYEERLVWGMGDGAGLQTHAVGPFRVGALNCWENWMPLARAALYAAGEDVHIMIWPGSHRLTQNITRFVAMESRSYVLSVGGLLREQDLPKNLTDRAKLVKSGEMLYDGGSCAAGPDGQWIMEPVCGREELLMVVLDPMAVSRERQNFDPAGHYSRPDVWKLSVDRRRHCAAE